MDYCLKKTFIHFYTVFGNFLVSFYDFYGPTVDNENCLHTQIYREQKIESYFKLKEKFKNLKRNL